MARLAVRRCCLLVGVALFVLGVTTTMRTAVRVNITAIFEEEDFEDFEAVFYRTLNDFNNASKDIHWFGQAVTVGRDLKATISAVCNLMEGRRSSLHVLVVFGNVSTIQTVNLLSQSLGIPMMGFMMDKGDGYIQVHNPFYLSLQPANTHMARGLVSLLAVNYWYHVTMLVENELRYDGFRNTFRKLTSSDERWVVEDELFLSRGLSDQQIQEALAGLSPNVSRIFVLHSSTSFAQRVLSLAPHALNRERQFAWIVTGNAYTRNERILRDFPLGTKAFLMNQDLHMDELLRDTLDFILAAFQENPHLLMTKSAWLQRGCWTMNGEPPSPYQNDVYNSLRKTVIHGLTGEVRFDEDGFMNISTFRVRNLVFDGRENVWQDVGCVQGREVRPFGIIWPGDAKSLKSSTEGRKRYRVVTNPVQPFVMTEAPHPDYGVCLTDTPCLNLTSKRKSRDEVLRAIDAYESGMGNRSDLYRIQCCRGLTIDLLKKLASDLDFEFTLYIVQDETYGQKKNGTWDGMMKDLIDHTAHFAVAAFSITRVRQKAIDFTYPYFFSGFSVLYSDRTRETNMLAFLEPFDIIVWFAIMISANFTAVAMALFEWNSPFGLNPWGRKRKHNYSLASGLTMVFSVLFGHTVKTKSPKAWPSKVMQNFWAFAAIFIIASYTANLAAFIAGKHAGINYYDIKDNRLMSIRIGALPGSAVDEFLKRLQSKLVAVSSRFPVPKTDVGIDWVIKGKLDAYLGDYPILDYARAHLAPSCELKLVSKIFGDDQYGLGLPKESPLKAALSKKIQEYHDMGYVDDLNDVHFADAHCFKKRISEEDSQLEVGHHAGLFVMLCVGFGVGLLTLVLEYVIFKWLVPFIRKSPPSSIWRSIHLMFFSQRLHRVIMSPELVSPQAAAREMLGIMRSRDFTRLFMKSTIRKNKLADMAKAKRLNRNFYDIVEKAKWLQEMQASGLVDDSTIETPNIIEIPLKDLTKVEVRAHSLAMEGGVDIPGASAQHVHHNEEEEDEEDEDEEEEEDKSDQCLLGGASKPHGADGRTGSHSDLLNKLRGLDSCSASSADSPRHRSLSADAASTPLLPLPSPPPPPLSSSSSSGSSWCRGARASKSRGSGKQCHSPSHSSPPMFSSPTRVRFSDSLPNGSLVLSRSGSVRHPLESDLHLDRAASDNLANDRLESSSGDRGNLFKAFSDDSRNLASSFSSKDFEMKDNNIVRSLLHKTRSYQDHLCCADTSLRGPVCLETMTKEELLFLWKTSELDLNRKLDEALKEKARLEKKLALLQHQSPV